MDELVKQAKRLFSSKKNGGRQVQKLTETLHTYKLVILALSIFLLVGSSQFRDNFKCQGFRGVSEKIVTDFCYLNGTTTAVARHDTKFATNKVSQPHAGFIPNTDKSSHRIFIHNYMRSLWAIFILLALCSYSAQKYWCSIFENDVLKALLQLVGSDESRLARAAENAKPYEMLTLLTRDIETEVQGRMNYPEVANLAPSEKVAHKIEIVDNHVNVYDHKLDYYPNQLTYLLLTKSTAAYKLSCLKLQRKLVTYSFLSTYLTTMQFFLPYVFIGPEYLDYGWRYFIAIRDYLIKLLTSTEPISQNSIDYNISSSIFPISTSCEYRQFGFTGQVERDTVQCTVAINEICSKLFVIIWWYVLINIFIEFVSLIFVLSSSLSSKATGWIYGLRYWPHSMEQADFIASFRCKRHKLLMNKQKKFNNLNGEWRLALKLDTKNNSNQFNAIDHLGEGEKKRMEAECDGLDGSPIVREQSSSAVRIGQIMLDSLANIVTCCSDKRRYKLESEPEEDLNVYYILYLLYLRLGSSRSKVEEVIRMTSGVLKNYLDDLESQLKEECHSTDGSNQMADAQKPDVGLGQADKLIS